MAGSPFVRIVVVVALATAFSASAGRTQQGLGGSVVEADRTVSSPWTPDQMRSFLPERGRFTFPAPYGTEGIRVTNATDCGGSDCVEAIGGASWRNIDAHVGRDSMFIFLGLRGVGPTLFRHDKGTGRTENLGPLFEAGSPFATRSGEGWYFSARRPATLYLTSGARLLRYDVLARTFETVLDATTEFGEDRTIGTSYSSDDDEVHSATLRDSTGGVLGCVAYRENLRRISYHPSSGALAGCEVDKSGRWLVIRENADAVAGADNRIVDLETGAETFIPGQDGAGGHSAIGSGYIIAADNGKGRPGGVRVWRFDQNPPQGELVYASGSTEGVDVGAIAHASAGPGVPLSRQYACAPRSTTATLPPASEIVCFRLDGSGETGALAQSIAQPKGNLDVTGRYFLWVSRTGDRSDALVVKVPEQPPMAPDAALSCPTSPVARNTNFKTTVEMGNSATDWVGSFRLGTPSWRWMRNCPYVHLPRPATITVRAPNRVGLYQLRLLANNTETLIGSCNYEVAYTGDAAPPQISGVGATAAGTSATIVWTTDEPADTQVEYGTTTAYGSSTTLNPSLVVSHSQAISGLAVATLYHYRVKSRDAVGNLATSADFTFTTLDTTPPSVSITAPAAGATVSGTLPVNANASDNNGVAGVQFKRNGINIGAEDTVAPYSVSWNTVGLANGSYTLTAVARDAAGNITTSAGVTVTVANDAIPPVVSITAPAGGATVSGTLPVTANATDNVGVVGVLFKRNGVNIGVEDTVAPYSVSWNTVGLANGSYTLTAVARDAAGNQTTSAGVTVIVANDTTPPVVSITAPAGGSTVSGTLPVTANATDNVGVVGVQFKVDGANLGAEDTTAPYSVSWNTTSVTNGSHILTAVARDAAGNTTTSAGVTVTVLNDTTPPVVSITAPAAGATVSGTLPVTANATDNVGVVGVLFKRNGVNIGVEDTVAPYSVSWNTVGLANGSYTLTAVARDAAGNQTTSAGVTVTVANDAIPPVVSITAPAGGSTVSGTLPVTANATDNVGVVGVLFKRNGVNIGVEDTVAPYSVSWNTVGLANGSYTLTAVARDAAGNITTSAGVVVTVANGGEVTLAPQDTFINLDATNQSTNPQLSTYTWPANKVANAILMKFDLSSIPAGAVPTDATLELALVASDSTPDTTYTVAAHKVVGRNPVITATTGFTSDGVTPWAPNTCCFNNVPLAQADISAAYDTQAIDKVAGFKSWTITTMVEEWLANPATNYGVLLNSDATRLADRFRSFASMENANTGLRPFLRVTYTIPPPDPIPPTVIMTAPAPGASLSGTVTVSANATDNVGVASVQFQLDGANLGLRDTTAPYSVSWNTATASPGAHTLRAIARDAAGNATTSAGVPVTVVDNTAPVITGVMASAITPTTALISWTTNETSDSQVEYGTTTGYGSSTTLNASLVTAHTAALAGLTPNTLYHYRARSRDAAGNLATSPDFTFTTTAVGGGGVVFESNWDTATGNSNNALRDGGRWTWAADFGGGQLLTVIPGGPAGHNALRVQQRGETFAADVQVDNFMALSTDYYVRFYMKNDDTSSSGDHIVTPDIYNYANLTYIRKMGGPTSWRFVVSLYACDATYPLIHWGPPAALANGQWYRFEYHVDYVANNRIQVHPRVYNAAGTLILSDADFQQEDFGTAEWNGRSDWTLASYYAGGYSFCVFPTWLNDFAMGNNGQQGATDTGRYWYYGAVQIRTDTWPGPAAPIGDPTPPTVSMTAPAAGATVSGTATTVSATASDNVGVVGVQFKLDGANLGAEDTTSPYSISWNTTTATNGAHTLTAVARDAAGNQTTSAGRTVTVANALGGIAALHPGDVGIENHPDVVFVEKFEEPTLPDLFARWTDIQNPPSAPLAFNADVPPGSPGARSLDVSWAGGSQDTAGLYKLLSPGINDTLYVRYHIKYPVNGMYRHEGIWMGGSNPPLTWPNPQAGIRPVGNDRFIAAAEQWDDRSRFDHYDYWMNMRASGDGMFWGNLLLNDPAAQVSPGQWTCVEHMVKLNNPTTALNGEHAIWLNGVRISHLGLGFPKGFWTNAIFTQNPAGNPFEGFRWRSDANLNINWIWLLVYAPDDPQGFVGHIKYDHVVVAKSYVGCLVP